MQMRVTGRDLAAALKTVLTVIEKRTTIPVLQCARLKVEGARLTIQGTDLDMTIKTECDILDGGDGFDALVPAAILAAAVKFAGSAPVDLEIVAAKDDKTTLAVSIADGDATFEIDLMSKVEDWPTLNTEAMTHVKTYETFGNGHFKLMLDTVAASISTEETRYYLNGVFWKAGAFVSTDGHRLIRHTYKHASEHDNVKAIIPRKAVGVLRMFATHDVVTKFIAQHEPKKGESWEPQFMVFMFGETRLTTKTIDGTYPDYERVIPKREAGRHVFEFDGDRLHDAVKRIRHFHSAQGTRTRAVAFGRGEDGKVVLTSSVLGEFKTQAKTFAAWPEDCDIKRMGFNGDYLLAFTKGGAMRLVTESDGSPALIEFEGEEDITRVIMPMRV